MIDLASADNLLLRLNPEMGYANNEVLISVSYSAMKGNCGAIKKNDVSIQRNISIPKE